MFYIYRKNNANFGMCFHCWPFLRTGSPHRAECMTYKVLQRHVFIMKHSVKNHFLHRRACCLYTTVNLQRWSNYRHCGFIYQRRSRYDHQPFTFSLVLDMLNTLFSGLSFNWSTKDGFAHALSSYRASSRALPKGF